MSNDLAPLDLELIRRTVASGANDDELQLYLHDCHRHGVHPLDKLLHFSVRVDRKTGARKYTPITSIDLFRSRAADTGHHAGTDDAVFTGEPGSRFPATATVTVYRIVQGVRCAFTATARWSEYKPEFNDFMWLRMPHTMLSKCAEALALRKAFPAELGGLYTTDEMAQAQRPDHDVHDSPEANTIPVEDQLRARQANPRPRKEYCTQAQQDAMRDLGDELGLTGAERIEIIRPYNVKRASSLSVEQGDEIILTLRRTMVAKLLSARGFNMDDVRRELPLVQADTANDLTHEEALATLTMLREHMTRMETA